jgi:microcin C transport system permease protein
MTGYFVRRFLLIIPTFIGITLAVFLVMNFVPGGPIERQIMRYRMAVASEGGVTRRRRGEHGDPARRDRRDEALLRLR